MNDLHKGTTREKLKEKLGRSGPWGRPKSDYIHFCIDRIHNNHAYRCAETDLNNYNIKKSQYNGKSPEVLNMLLDELDSDCESGDPDCSWYPGESDWMVGHNLGSLLSRYPYEDLERAGVIENSVVSPEKLARFLTDQKSYSSGRKKTKGKFKGKGEGDIAFLLLGSPSCITRNTEIFKKV